MRVLARQAKDAETKMFCVVREEALQRLGDYCTINQWQGGGGTYGWMAGFEDPSCHWIRNRSSPLS